jgi:threonine dehydratase
MLDLEAIQAARRRITPHLRATPLVHSPALSARSGCEVWLKLECLQPTGSFKVRGALNRVSRLAPAELARGLVTGSAGNHGLGVALAAQLLGHLNAHIFVPQTAPRAKLDKLRRFDVQLHVGGLTYEDAHQAAEDFAQETGAVYIPAYDHPDVIAGQGTVGLEILADLPEVDQVLVPVGGGGLIAGVALAVKALRPGCRVLGLQPQASPSAWLSLRDGRAYDPYDHEPTIADGLAGGFGELPFELAGKRIDRVLLAGEAELRRAVFTLVDEEQLVVEPSGAIAVAPLLDGALDAGGQQVVCVLTGANLETALLQDILLEFVS